MIITTYLDRTAVPTLTATANLGSWTTEVIAAARLVKKSDGGDGSSKTANTAHIIVTCILAVTAFSILVMVVLWRYSLGRRPGFSYLGYFRNRASRNAPEVPHPGTYASDSLPGMPQLAHLTVLRRGLEQEALPPYDPKDRPPVYQADIELSSVSQPEPAREGGAREGVEPEQHGATTAAEQPIVVPEAAASQTASVEASQIVLASAPASAPPEH